MGKITVKHYLNTNLKPYLVRGEKYYSVYILITVNRKTTKVPSLEFGEFQTESDFEDIINTPEMINEVQTIENIISSQLDLFDGEFDTQLFSAFYNLMPNYKIGKLDSRIADLNTYEGKYLNGGWGFYDWFMPETQMYIVKILNTNTFDSKQLNTISRDIKVLNKAILVLFFGIISLLSKSMNKYRTLEDRYSLYCDDYEFQANVIAFSDAK